MLDGGFGGLLGDEILEIVVLMFVVAVSVTADEERLDNSSTVVDGPLVVEAVVDVAFCKVLNDDTALTVVFTFVAVVSTVVVVVGLKVSFPDVAINLVEEGVLDANPEVPPL